MWARRNPADPTSPPPLPWLLSLVRASGGPIIPDILILVLVLGGAVAAFVVIPRALRMGSIEIDVEPADRPDPPDDPAPPNQH
ncbi:hypothetical protein Ntsu_13360 [Nocardia sp. IFM 10818]